MSDKKNKLATFGKYAVGSAVALGASIIGAASCFADYDMSGPALNGSAVTGFKQGVADSAQTLQSSLNNAYLTEIAIMFIGFAVIVGVVLHVVKGHRRI